MEYVHVRSLEKYHPGYKDRELSWGKIFINMAEGDAEVEMLDEIDFSRLVKIILLELRNKKPLPNNDEFWKRKGIDIKKRPMSLTLQMLHNFVTVVSDDSKSVCIREEKIREDKRREDNVHFDFLSLWNNYPKRIGKKEAERHFNASVKTDQDYQDIQTALKNYLKSDRVKKGFIQNGSTWFNNFRDWVVDPEPISTKDQEVAELERLMKKC